MTDTIREQGWPRVLGTPAGLRAVVVAGGAPASLGTDRIELVQHAASALAPGLLQLWLRDRATGRCWPMLGAGSGSTADVRDGNLVVAGQTDDDLGWRVTLTLEPTTTAWAWHVEVRNHGADGREVDVVHAHDVALAAPGALRTNELYVSQYLDIVPLHGDTFGTAIAVRQNQAQSGVIPWCVIACTTPVVAWATDALDVHGLAARAGRPPVGLGGDLPSRRRQHEHTLATLQTARWRLEPGQRLTTSFAGLLVAGPPGRDVRRRPPAGPPGARPRPHRGRNPAASQPQQATAPSGAGLAAPTGVVRRRPHAGRPPDDRRRGRAALAGPVARRRARGGRHVAVVLHGRRRARGDPGQGGRHAATPWHDPAHRRLRCPRPLFAHRDELDDGVPAVVPDARPRLRRSRPDDGARLPGPAPRPRGAGSRGGGGPVAAARPAVRVLDGPRRGPLGARASNPRAGTPAESWRCGRPPHPPSTSCGCPCASRPGRSGG